MSISDIPDKVRCLLWAKAAGRCEFDGCNKLLYRDWLTQTEMNFADVAHIIGDSPNGPRGDVVLSKEYCSNLDNLMLMCKDHHKMIDIITQTYSVEVLRKMKKAHEERVETLTEMKTDRTSHVVIFNGCVGEIPTKIEYRDALQAMKLDWFPARPFPIMLGLANSKFEDKEEFFWMVERVNLERQFAEQVKPFLLNGQVRNHFSIFAFAPQPLLIKFGSLFTDMYPAEVYQLHREPTTWEWQPDLDNFEYIVKEPSTHYPQVALNLSLSATIESQRIERVMIGKQYSEWKMTIAKPTNDFLKGRRQLQLFREEFRSLLNSIKAIHGEDAIIHIFPAVPVSIAVEIGRVRQPKADLPFVVYDQNFKTKGFSRALSIGEGNNGKD